MTKRTSLVDLQFVLDKNYDRIKNLMILHSNIIESNNGKKNIQSSEVLRATIVLLHATFEDFLRSLLKIKLPESSKEVLCKIPIYNSTNPLNRKTNFNLGELTEFKEKNVNDLISLSIDNYLNVKSFNNTNDISKWLEKIDIKITEKMSNHFSYIDEMISRRHNIVHQADRENVRDAFSVKSISTANVKKWIDIVDEFILLIVKQI